MAVDQLKPVRRWKIKKFTGEWWLFKSSNDPDRPRWQYLNRYPTFEEARQTAVKIVDLYTGVFGSLHANRTHTQR